MLRAQQHAADAYLPLSGAFEGAEYARRLEFAAVQLLTPNCQKRPTTKPRASAGKISKTIFTAKLTGLSHFGATPPPEGYSILFDGGHQPGRPHHPRTLNPDPCVPPADSSPADEHGGESRKRHYATLPASMS
jgi:hypothetical protein